MSIPQRFKKLSFIFSIVVAMVGFLVLIGWLGDISLFKSISPNWISMKANAAICFLFAGIILMVGNSDKNNAASKWVIPLLSAIIFFIGAVTVLEYVFDLNAGIDELIFKDEAKVFPGIPPGRQSLFSAAYFMLFGFCYLPGINKILKPSWVQILHIASAIFVLSAAMSYMFGTYVFVGVQLKSIHVIHSTLSFLFLILALLFSQPEFGIMKLVSSNSSGGKIIRNTLPLLVLVAIVLGWLRLKGEQAGLYNRELGLSIFILAMIVIIGYLIFSDAGSFTKAEGVLKQSEERLMRANETLELAEQQAKLGNWEFEIRSQFRHWSNEVFRIFEIEPGKNAPSNEEFLELIHPDDKAPFKEFLEQMLERKDVENIIFRTNPQRIRLKYLLPTWQIVRDEKGIPVKYFGTLQDITERVEAREAIKQREELFSKAFHSKVFGLAILNQERRVVDINETLAGLIAYRREELIGKTSLEIGLTDPVYVKKRDELLLLLLQKGRIENYELQMQTRKGKPLTLLLSVEPLTLNSHSHWLISLVDTTEKKKTEKELMQSENRLRTILNTEPECVKIIDHNGELTYMNPAGLAMMEADDFEMVKGRKGLSNIHSSYLKKFYSLVTNVFSGHPGKMEYEITGFKGTDRWMETHMVPLRDEGKKIISLLAVTRDVTEHKKAEQQVKESEQRLNRAELMGSLGHGYYNIKNGSMHLSEGLYKIFGVTPATFSHTIDGLKSVIHPDDFLIQQEAVETMFEKGEVEVEFRIVRPTGEIRNVLFKTKMTKNEKGELIDSFTTALCVTDRKKAEAKIKKSNEQLRELTAHLQKIREEERRRIGREIHDELGQSLTILKIKIEKVKSIKGYEKSLDESITEMLKQVDECISSSRKISTELRPAILDDLGLIAALEWQAGEFRIKTRIKTVFKTALVELELPPDFAIAIFRIFQESLTNVARHADATIVTSSLFIEKGNIVLKIVDNGKGFDTTIIGTKKTLGLIGMKERALLMNGTYNISSTPGAGTEITVIIPLPVG